MIEVLQHDDETRASAITHDHPHSTIIAIEIKAFFWTVHCFQPRSSPKEKYRQADLTGSLSSITEKNMNGPTCSPAAPPPPERECIIVFWYCSPWCRPDVVDAHHNLNRRFCYIVLLCMGLMPFGAQHDLFISQYYEFPFVPFNIPASSSNERHGRCYGWEARSGIELSSSPEF